MFRKIIVICLLLAMFAGCDADPVTVETTAPDRIPVTTAASDTNPPETTVPETTAPEVTVPETTVPETTVPETTVPETTVPPETEPVQLAVPDEKIWYATCNQHMSLRKSPSTDAKALATIRRGEQMEVIGWYKAFAKVKYKNKTGYVLASYIQPANEGYFTDFLTTVDFVSTYTYKQMNADIAAFQEKYPELVKVDSIGKSELGQNLPVVRIGNENAKTHLLYTASTHGCEHQTTWLLMAVMDYWLSHGIEDLGDVCFHFIPMVNPDGVQIAQTGKLNSEQKQIYYRDVELGYTNLSMKDYARVWKANGKGVDINRNFDVNWKLLQGVSEPSYKLYAGTKAFSSAEANALKKYVNKYDFDATLSFHTAGSVLYYNYGNHTKTNNSSKKLAQMIRDFSGYILIDSNSVDAGGFKDWAIDSLHIPSLTVEIGAVTPVNAQREMASIFARMYLIIPNVAQWAQK